jgi:hypothetical protein
MNYSNLINSTRYSLVVSESKYKGDIREIVLNWLDSEIKKIPNPTFDKVEIKRVMALVKAYNTFYRYKFEYAVNKIPQYLVLELFNIL